MSVSYKSLLLSDNYLLRRIGVAVEQFSVLMRGVGNASYSSEGIRFTGIFYVLELLFERPFLGFGLGTVSCNSGVVCLLTNMGTIGFIVWLVMMSKLCEVDPHSKKEKLFLIEIMILPNIFLNDYETIMCFVIPFAAILYGIITNNNGKTV